MAIGQPLTHGQLSGQLHVQIPVTVSGQFNLSSATTENDIPPYALQTAPLNNNGYHAYSSTAGLASLVAPLSLGLAAPGPSGNMAQNWFQESAPQGLTPSPQFSPTVPYPEEFRRRSSVQPSIPRRHPAHTLNASVLPIVAAAIPSFQAPPNGAAQQPTDDQLREMYESWVSFDGQQSSYANGEIPYPHRLKWNRFWQIPRGKMGRKMAGKWDDNDKIKTEKPESAKSIKSAPSILC